MHAIGRYLLSVTSAALICALIRNLFPEKNAAGTIIHMLAGLLVVSTLISPVLDLSAGDLPAVSAALWNEAEQTAQTGSQAAHRRMQAVICSRLEAYILKEARQYRAELEIHFSDFSPDRLYPGGITLTGRWSPYARARLADWIEAQAGIAKEDQRWIG